ncbi:hypothetical protein [Mycobacterium ulcerans]|uniref:hypothetical protein n=1 Tax=Mycobacterium ulcerans TaxID=1809 RepID=UPI0012FE545A|nr:hypothetical protein [Mycobacterium ulcerans]
MTPRTLRLRPQSLSSRPAEKRAWPLSTGGYGGAGNARTQAWPNALIAADITPARRAASHSFAAAPTRELPCRDVRQDCSDEMR